MSLKTHLFRTSSRASERRIKYKNFQISFFIIQTLLNRIFFNALYTLLYY